MGRFTIEVKLKDFSAAHRIVGNYNGACKNLHGHNYMVVIFIYSTKLDKTGFVVDFAEIKQIINNWIEKNIDHTVIVSASDTALYNFVKEDEQRHYLIPGEDNTSAENIAKHLFEKFCGLLFNYPNINLQKVQVYESMTSSASYQQD